MSSGTTTELDRVAAPSARRRRGTGASSSRRGIRFLGVPALVFIVVAYLSPIVVTLAMSFGWPHLSFSEYGQFFGYGPYIALLVRTVAIALIAVAVTLLIGYPLAYSIAFASPGVRRVLLLCVFLPFVTSIIVRTFGFMVLLGRLGPITSFLHVFGLGSGGYLQTPVAVVAGFVNFLLPLMVLPLVNAMRQIDPAVLRSGESLGAGSAYVFLRVFVPMTAPGIEAGCILTFVYGVGAFITPELLGGNSASMIGSQIQVTLAQTADFGFAAAMAAILAVIVFIALAVYRSMFGGSVEWLVSRSAGSPRETRRTRRRGVLGRRGHRGRGPVSRGLGQAARGLDSLGAVPWRFGRYLISLIGVLIMVVPGLIAIPVSFSGTRALVFPPNSWSLQWLHEFFTAQWLQPLQTSVIVGVVGAVVAPALSFGAALAAERSSAQWVRRVTSTLLLMPAVVPAVVAALAFYIAFLKINLADTVPGIAIAVTCMVMPFSYTIIAASVRSLDTRYEYAAASLGASTLVVIRRIYLPLLRGSILSAMAVSFLIAFDESAVSIFLSGLNVSTLSNQMFNSTLQQTDPTIGVVGTLVLLLILAFLGAQALVTRARLARNRPISRSAHG